MVKTQIEAYIDFLLREKYFSEFEIIDGLSQHKKGQNFIEWKEEIVHQYEL